MVRRTGDWLSRPLDWILDWIGFVGRGKESQCRWGSSVASRELLRCHRRRRRRWRRRRIFMVVDKSSQVKACGSRSRATIQSTPRHRDRSLGWCGRMRREGGKVWEGQQSVVGRAMGGKRGASRAVWEWVVAAAALLLACKANQEPGARSKSTTTRAGKISQLPTDHRRRRHPHQQQQNSSSRSSGEQVLVAS